MMKTRSFRMCRTALPLIALAVAFTTTGSALAGSTGTGMVRLANASSAVTSSVTARELILDGCSNSSLTTQGLDAWVIDLKADNNSTTQLTVNISEAIGSVTGVTGVTVWYLSSNCGLLLSHTVTQPVVRMNKYGPYTFADISAAKWAVVSFHSGFEIDFNWTALSP